MGWLIHSKKINGTSLSIRTDALILGYKYAYNSNGNISSIYPSLSTGGASSTANQTYTYDKLGQLSKVVDNAAGYT